MENELKDLISSNEEILYQGKPNKKCFVFESIFNPLLPFAIIWGCMDSKILSGNMYGGSVNYFILLFMIFHLMPVWLYLGGVVFAFRKYKNTYYIVTDHAIYVSKGIFTKSFNSKPFAELSHVDLHRGIFDQIFKVGDILITTNQITRNNVPAVISINSISNYMEVYNIVKKLQKDIYSDVMFPNDLRPKENHGYRTRYKG